MAELERGGSPTRVAVATGIAVFSAGVLFGMWLHRTREREIRRRLAKMPPTGPAPTTRYIHHGEIRVQ